MTLYFQIATDCLETRVIRQAPLMANRRGMQTSAGHSRLNMDKRMSKQPQHNAYQERYHPDFDELLQLAKNDPARFEARRLEYIELFFSRIPPERHRRLRGLQWQIDQARHLARTPMASCLQIMNMMRDSLNRLNDQQQILVTLAITKSGNSPQSATDTPAIPDSSHGGKVIPFPSSR